MRYDLRVDLPSALHEAKYQDFFCSASTTLSFALAAKITFINFDLATENRVGFLLKIIDNNCA